MSDGGSAQPVVPVVNGLISAAPALRVAVVSDGRPILGGPSLPVYVVTDNRPTQGNTPVPVVLATGIQASNVMAGPAIPVVVVSGSLNLNTPPVNTVLPAISGTLNLGQLLSTTDGTWTGTAPITYTYQWKRGGVAIGGATASTYTTVLADVGQTITVTVTGTNVAGNASATSAGSVIFTPTSIAGLLLWIKADSLALADGAAVAAWADSSNANTYTQGTGTKQPTFGSNVTDTINSLPVVKFDGTDDTLVGGALAVSTAATMCIVARANTAVNGRAVFGVGNGVGVQARRFTLEINGTGLLYYENAAAVYNAFNAGYIINNTPFLVLLRKNGTDVKTYINQVLKRTDVGNASLLLQNNVAFGSAVTVDFFDKHLAEVLVYDTALADPDRAKVEIYLGKKYGLF